MKEITNEMRQSVIDQRNAFRKEHGLAELTEQQINRVIGNNGMNIGDTVKLTGEIDLNVPIKDAKGKITGSYIGVKTTNGTFMSIKALMNITSLRGYVLDGQTKVEYSVKENNKNVTKERFVTSELIEDFNFSMVNQPECRNENEFAAFLIAYPEIIKDAELRLLGTVYKPFIASEDKTDLATGEKYLKGMQRAIAQKLYSLEAA